MASGTESAIATIITLAIMIGIYIWACRQKI